MTNRGNVTDGQHEHHDSERAGCKDAEARVSQALATLRLLSDKNNTLSLGDVIGRARALAEVYADWEKSGTLIKDIVVRLSDGREIAVDQSNVASLCGLHFRNAFPPSAILQVWKKADEFFGKEVQLLSLALQNVPASGYNFEKTYKNGQTLSLAVQPQKDGQLYISVDCTQPEERVMVATQRNYSWMPLLVPAALTLGKLGSLLRNWRPAPTLGIAFRVGLVITTGLLVALAGGHVWSNSLHTHASIDLEKISRLKVELLVLTGDGYELRSSTDTDNEKFREAVENMLVKSKSKNFRVILKRNKNMGTEYSTASGEYELIINSRRPLETPSARRSLSSLLTRIRGDSSVNQEKITDTSLTTREN